MTTPPRQPRKQEQQGQRQTRRDHIIDVLMLLEPGEVTTYGDVAAAAGYPRHARLVGQILRDTEIEVPWWRVVNAAGRLVPGNELEQSELLLAEGVMVNHGRVRTAPTGRFHNDLRSSAVTIERSGTTQAG